MRKFPWLRLGVIAALWTTVAGAAVCGWIVGKHDAAREFSDLQRRLITGTPPARACGTEVELLNLQPDSIAPPLGRNEAGPSEIAAPGLFHLRSLITAR